MFSRRFALNLQKTNKKKLLPALVGPLVLQLCWPLPALCRPSPAHWRPLPAFALAFAGSAGLCWSSTGFFVLSLLKANENASARPLRLSASVALPALCRPSPAHCRPFRWLLLALPASVGSNSINNPDLARINRPSEQTFEPRIQNNP